MADILVVDDRAINRHFLVTLLGYAGHSTREAGDGAEALAITRATRPQLVISDVLMPTMDGVEFAKRLHADPEIAHIPIIFYTATYRLKEARAMAETCGVSIVLTKPAEPQAIIDAVNSALGIAQSLSAPAPAPPPGTPALRLPDRFSGPLSELEAMRLRMQQAIDHALDLVGERGELQQITDRLLQSLDTVQAMSLKLSALIEVGIELASERDVGVLLEKFSGAVQDVLGARYAAVGILDGGGSAFRHFLIHGVSEQTRAAIGIPDPRSGALQALLETDRVLRRSARPSLDIGLPAAHPPIASVLAVRIESSNRTFGWLYLADKLGSDEFNLDDEQLASTMAASLALNYENMTLLAESKESELRFRQLAENVREVFFLVSADRGQLLYISPEYERIWGRSRASLYENPLSWTDAIHPDDRARIVARLERQPGVDDFEYEYRIIRPDGTLRTIWTRGFGVQDETGKLCRFAGIAEDVTERNRLREVLREREAGLNRAQHLAQLAHVVTGAGGVFETWSETLPSMIGQDPAQMIRSTREWLDIVHPEDREMFRQKCIDAGRSGKRTDVAYRLRHGDGSTIFVHQVMDPLDDAASESGASRWFNTIQNITDQKRAEEEIRQLNADLERRVIERTAELSEANKDLEAFGASVSHDLRAPLNKVHGFAQILLEDCGHKLGPDNVRHLQAINRNATNMAQLIDDLLAFSRLGREPINAMPIDMTAMANEVAAELVAGAGGRPAEVRVAVLPKAQGDPALLRQVWINLIGNALKYSGRVASPVVEISGDVRGSECCYRVKDNGAGFDMRYAAKLFEAFQRLHSASEFPGTGVGLATVHRIVVRHGGRIWAEGKEGEGATFSFTLPAEIGG